MRGTQLDTGQPATTVINDQVAATRIYGNFMDALIATLNQARHSRPERICQTETKRNLANKKRKLETMTRPQL